MALLWRSLLQFALPQVKKSTNVLCLMKHSLDTLELVYENVRDILEKDPLYLKVIDHLQTTPFIPNWLRFIIELELKLASTYLKLEYFIA